jgi:uncharacterized membrane protein
MLELFQAGGFPMFAVVGFGLAALAAACLFAWRPRAERLGFIVGMSLATAFISIAGVAKGMAKVFTFVSHGLGDKEWDTMLATRIVLEGISETMSPVIFGFSLVSLVAFACAIGLRRMSRDAA